jgi:hypothetical protein
VQASPGTKTRCVGRAVGLSGVRHLIVHRYEDWPRGRIVFDRSRDLFVLYADRKLLTPATIARIEPHFHLPAVRTEVTSGWHYQSTETPNELGA